MRRAAPILAALAAALAGCPIPQPLPDYPPGTITPPRILAASVRPSDPVIRVGVGCTYPNDEPSFELGASIFDSDAIEPVAARWFLNYDPSPNHASHTPIGGDFTVLGNSDPTALIRVITESPFDAATPFRPYRHRPPDGTGTKNVEPFNDPDTIRVVELLVSNNFDADPTRTRQAAPNYEVALHRWVFLLVPGTENCGHHPAVP